MAKRTRRQRRSSKRRNSKPADARGLRDSDFEKLTTLQEHLVAYAWPDVLAALTVSELWWANSASGVRHQLALRIALSVDRRLFADNPIDSYEKFSTFIRRVYEMLPKFPSLEDFVPEQDWGEVKFPFNNRDYRIFYGCGVERIPDFVDAMRMALETGRGQEKVRTQALSDLCLALQIQDNLIREIGTTPKAEDGSVRPGWLEVPEYGFWEKASKALRVAGSKIDDSWEETELVLRDRPLAPLKSIQEFVDLFFSGKSAPILGVRDGKVLLPVAPRSALSVVVDWWGSVAESFADSNIHELANQLSAFLAARFSQRNLIRGPCLFYATRGAKGIPIGGVILGESKAFLVLPVRVGSVEGLAKLEEEIGAALDGPPGTWAIRRVGTDDFFAFGLNGRPITRKDVEIVGVLPKVTTAPVGIFLGELASTRLLFLPDFLTIFESVRNPSDLERFFAFQDSGRDVFGPIIGPADTFGAYRDSEGVIVDGAIEPDLIALDPHWGSSWRYRELAKYWAAAPLRLPSDVGTWRIETSRNYLYSLTSRCEPTLAWGALVGPCMTYNLFEFDAQSLDAANGRLVELICHCLADALAERRDIVDASPLFFATRIVTRIRANERHLARTDASADAPPAGEVFSNWRVLRTATEITAEVDADTQRVQSSLADCRDASFEVECVLEWLRALSAACDLPISSAIEVALADTRNRKPRFMVSKLRRQADVPEHADPQVPSPTAFKLARKELAQIFKGQGIESGRYELQEAKPILDAARDAARRMIHSSIDELPRGELLEFCIEQHDALVASFSAESSRVRMSLKHDVEYNRAEKLAAAQSAFTRHSQSFRYLLEYAVSSAQPSGAKEFYLPDALNLVARVDWLLVLYSASDVLHNGIDVAGLELDNSFVPNVFYSEGRDQRERDFGLEAATAKLGIGIDDNDDVDGPEIGDPEWNAIDDALVKDAGFTLTHLCQSLIMLSQWQTAQGRNEMRLHYRAPKDDLVARLVDSIEKIDAAEVESIVEFLRLSPKGIRTLLGKTEPEGDVPVWEHFKRGDRYALKPLIAVRDDLVWGAATAHRAFSIWQGSFASGYLPADYPWPNVKAEVRKIKARLELDLEEVACRICSRATPYVERGIDFFKRYPAEGFDDVGDFDVLAYWPNLNQWAGFECKYNQPPFCVKDARRLRERIFGAANDRGHFEGIDRRDAFLKKHSDRMAELLEWPIPATEERATFRNVYVSRNTYWWMKYPPYAVSSEFVRIDGLMDWLRRNKLASRNDSGAGS